MMGIAETNVTAPHQGGYYTRRCVMRDLKEDIKNFGDAAVRLTEAISDNGAEELVSINYPFDKSFDELVLDILRWRDTVCHKLNK